MKIIVRKRKKETELKFKLTEGFRSLNGKPINNRIMLSRMILKSLGELNSVLIPLNMKDLTGLNYELVSTDSIEGMKYFFNMLKIDKLNLRKIDINRCKREILDMLEFLEETLEIEMKILP